MKRRKFKLTASPDPPEIQFHAAVADLLDWLLLPPAVYTTFPAGWGKLPPAIAGWLKRCGLKPGMPDILVFYDHQCIGIELKKPGKSPSLAQREMHAGLLGAGVRVYVCLRMEEVIAALVEFNVPMRAHHLDGVVEHAAQTQSNEITTDGLAP